MDSNRKLTDFVHDGRAANKLANSSADCVGSCLVHVEEHAQQKQDLIGFGWKLILDDSDHE